MDLYKIASILGFSIAIAAILGLVRYRKINTSYRPFLWIIALGFLNHSWSLIAVRYFHSNSINGNIFVLLEAFLWLGLFRNLVVLTAVSHRAMLCIVALAWITDNLILHTLNSANAGFRIISGFLLIFLAIEQLTRLITSPEQNLWKNASFLICTGLVIYYAYKVFVEVFFLMETDASLFLIKNIYAILVFVSCLVNLLYAWAVIWIPGKNQSTFWS